MEGFVQNSGPSYSDVPYGERWELLKPYLEQLYIHEKRKLSDIVEILKSRHKFYASESQYKRQFGIWKLKRNIPTSKKTAICETVHTRAQMGKSSVVQYKGQDVDPGKLRRLIKTKRRQDIKMEIFMVAGYANIEALSGHALQCGHRIFMNWDMPHMNLRVPRVGAYDQVSPYGPSAATPVSDIVVKTPSTHTGPSPRHPPSPGDILSPRNAASPMAVAIRDNVKMDRARLFVQGRHAELFEGMSRGEKKITTDWLHQFWLFSYKTAKEWGHGPRKWTSSMLGFDEHSQRAISNLPDSPGFAFGSPATYADNQHNTWEYQLKRLLKPTPLCRWTIHARRVQYERIPSPPPLVTENADPNDGPWLDAISADEVVDTLRESLANNSFSNIEVRDLPISLTQVAKAAERSPETLREEAFGFSIMARNIELVSSVLENEGLGRFANGGLYPLHLAASYLDGGKTCCYIFSSIVSGMPVGEVSVRKLYTNHLNHTVLDNLMIAILKAHTSCSPSVVDDAFKKEPRFAGEEVDICGRWDADSKCIRALLASGIPNIPFEWKHMFCHTSVQVICHCIAELFGPHWAPDINSPSGIFTKRCPNETCGLKLQLMPLHTLVVTAVNLASQGSHGETLFGILACLLCLLKNGADPLLTANVSLDTLLGNEDSHQCSHEELDPLELAQKVPDYIIGRWSHEINTGWQLFCHVLELSQAEWRPKSSGREKLKRDIPNEFAEFIEDSTTDEDAMSFCDSDISDESSQHRLPAECWEDHECWFGDNRDLSTLWAAVQTEFVTYRRLEEGDPWISPNFNMESLLESLTSGRELAINLVQKEMMGEHCKCGQFDGSDEVCALSEEVSRQYFSNLDDWSRTTFLRIPDHDVWFY